MKIFSFNSIRNQQCYALVSMENENNAIVSNFPIDMSTVNAQ